MRPAPHHPVLALVLALAAPPACVEPGVIEAQPIDWAWELSPDNPDVERLEDGAVGVRLHHPRRWQLHRDPVLFDTHGFVLTDPSAAEAGDVHGNLPVVRVARDYAGGPTDLEARVAAKLAEYPDAELARRDVTVGGHPAVAVGPVPGALPTIFVYVATGRDLYRVVYYGAELDARGEAVLASLELVPPTTSIESLRLQPVEQARFGLHGGPIAVEPKRAGELAPAAPVAAGEYPMSDGCWAQPSGLFIQTAHSWDANGGSGWTQMGTPNFWGDNTHGSWGLGRCYSGYYTNDLYAIDYYLDVGDRLYAPFAEGYVTYAGWDPEAWWNYGYMVVIQTPSGKFVSLSAHLSAVNVVPGQYVTSDTVIGWAGSTGYAAPYPHLHQAYYRWPSFSWGRPYGGRGVMPTAMTYLGGGGGVYTRFFKGKWASW